MKRFIGQAIFEHTPEGNEVLEQNYDPVDALSSVSAEMDDLVVMAIQELIDTFDASIGSPDTANGLHQISFVIELSVEHDSDGQEVTSEALWSELHTLTEAEVEEFTEPPEAHEPPPMSP